MIEVNDHDTCRASAARLREGERQLPHDMNEQLEDSAEKVRKEILDNAASILPRSGGLASLVAATNIVINKKSAGVTLTADSRYNLPRIDEGQVSHPVYGQGPNVTQEVTPGFWSKPISKAGPEITKDLETKLDKLAREMDR